MELKLGLVIALVVGSILLAALIPTALDTLYDQATDTSFRWDNGVEGGSAGANDTATFAIFKLLPLFAVIGGMAILGGVALKEMGGI